MNTQMAYHANAIEKDRRLCENSQIANENARLAIFERGRGGELPRSLVQLFSVLSRAVGELCRKLELDTASDPCHKRHIPATTLQIKD